MTTILHLDKPSLGRIAIELLTTEERTSSGLWLPSGRETIANAGRVVMVCDQYEAADDDQDSSPSGPLFSVGQIVVIGKYNGIEVELNDLDGGKYHKKFLIVNESDVLCTLKEVEYAPETA